MESMNIKSSTREKS